MRGRNLYRQRISRTKIKGIIGLLCIVLAFAGWFYWENYGREAFMYQDVIVFKDAVQKGTVIEKDMIGIRKIETGTVIEDAVTDWHTLIGKRSNTYIPGGLQLCDEFFSDAELATGDGSYICSIPMDWVYAYPQTLRRGDRVHFYSINENDVSSPDDYSDYGAVNGDMQESIKQLVSSDDEIISVTVAYVKDSGNREVVDVTPDRIDGSSAVSHIEVVIDKEKYDKLAAAAKNSKVFVLMYE